LGGVVRPPTPPHTTHRARGVPAEETPMHASVEGEIERSVIDVLGYGKVYARFTHIPRRPSPSSRNPGAGKPNAASTPGVQ
jgi:hypothetical protein